MNFRSKPKSHSSFIDIAPFLDTVFNLLIFFALSLNFISTPGIRVNLPKSSAQEIVRKEKDVRIVVTAKGEIHVGGELVPIEALPSRLDRLAKANPQAQVLIQADAAVPHGLVVSVMDAARTVGLNRLAIITTPREESEREKG